MYIIQISCSTESCNNALINATMANSLELDCTGNGCDAATIYCPIGDNTSCSIKCNGNTCQYAIIRTGNDNKMNSFNLECGYISSYACRYVDVQLTSSSIDNVTIECDGTYGCRQIKFDTNSILTDFSINCIGTNSCWFFELNLLSSSLITDLSIICSNSYSCRYTAFSIGSTIINDFNLSCSSTGCWDMDISLPSTSINSVFWECRSGQSCNSATMTFTNNITMNSYKRTCDGSNSCYSSFLTFDTNANINQLEWSCSDDQYSCSYIRLIAEEAIIEDLIMDCNFCELITVNANINQNFDFKCNDCDSSTITLNAVQSDVNYNIECVKNFTKSVVTVGSCYGVNLNIYGYGENEGNMTMICGHTDCDSAKINGYNLNIVDITCQDTC